MGYTYDCDGCGGSYHDFPPFAGEFTEQFLKTRGGAFATAYKPGQKVTFCADCMELFVLAGKLLVCQRCGSAYPATDFPSDRDNCPQCDADEFTIRPRETEGNDD